MTSSPATSTARRSSSPPPRSAASRLAATTPRRRRWRPKGFITGAEYKWITVYKGYADDLKSGKPLPNMWAGGYPADMVQNTPFGAGARRRGAQSRDRGDRRPEDIRKPIYVGPLKDNKGNRGHQQDLRQ